MKYSIIIYCPDQHITYNLNTLEKIGVGGGITARIRIAHALAKEGHKVTLFINCPKEELIRGVHYRQFQKIGNEKADIFIASSSGGGVNLNSLDISKIQSKLKLLLIHGVDLPKNTNPDDFDYIYILSNFVRKLATENWKLNPRKIFVTHRGVQGKNNLIIDKLERNPYNLVYMGHPSKGLDTAISIFHLLKKENPNFKLHIYGGNRLWGGIDDPIIIEPDLVNHGLVGQHQLTKDIRKMSFSLNLQAREEPFGMVVTESLQAGCIVVASPVGAYPEIIHNGYNGFLVSGLHTEAKTRDETARLIMNLMQNGEYMKYIRKNAMHTPITWEIVASVWQSHWDWVLDNPEGKADNLTRLFFHCSLCNNRMLTLADGLHCIECGNFQQSCNEKLTSEISKIRGSGYGS